jgi:hypothetical protein
MENFSFFTFHSEHYAGRDSSVGIATGYELDGPGIEYRCGRDFPHLSRPTLRLAQPHKKWVPGLSRGQSGRGLALTDHFPYSAEVKERV